MKKVFFTASPMQDVLSQNGADTPYKSVNNPKLQYDDACCFPIIPLINGYVDSGDDVYVYVVSTENHNMSQKNYTEIEKRILSLCAKKQVGTCAIKPIHIPFDDTVETHLATFQKMIELVHDGDTVFADFTYQGRCLPIVEMMALNFAYRTYNNCSVECVVYGNKNFQTGEKFIYDQTSLFLMDQIVNELAKSKNQNPVKAIETILDINASMEE